MSISDQQTKALRQVQHLGVDFALWREPGADNARFIADDNESPLLTDTEFFATPWLGKYGQRFIVRHRLDENSDLTHRTCRVAKPRTQFENTDKNEYLVRVCALIDDLRKTHGKTVISRILCGTGAIDLINLAREYFNANANAFCALFSICGDVWLVASPEILLTANHADGKLTTMALAGTRPRGTVGPWDAKNLQEQALVAEFVSDCLRENAVDFVCQGPVTRPAGNNIEHLCTTFCGALPKWEIVERLLDCLNPTPALCGTPRELALSRIRAIERHERSFYGGYIGISQPDKGLLQAWVTLRCARFAHGSWCAYAGGGITEKSTAPNEWEETNLKLSVITELIKKNAQK